jgi:hypothetical protein
MNLSSNFGTVKKKKGVLLDYLGSCWLDCDPIGKAEVTEMMEGLALTSDFEIAQEDKPLIRQCLLLL